MSFGSSRGIDMSHLYRVLGVPRGADGAQIKSAYRKLAKDCHPDLHGGSERAQLRFREVCSAYETLANPAARAVYDAACAQVRRRARRRLLGAATTMAASFMFTVGSGMVVATWMLGT
jgi:DnaJ-class molecular chaperone